MRICHGNSVCLSVRPSVTRVYCIKTAERIIGIISLSTMARPSCQFFDTKGCCVNLLASPLTGAPNTRGSDFPQIRGYITETVIDRDKYLLQKTNIKSYVRASYVLCRMVPLSVTFSDPAQFQGRGHSIV